MPKDGVMRVHSQGQGAWEDRRQIAAVLGLGLFALFRFTPPEGAMELPLMLPGLGI